MKIHLASLRKGRNEISLTEPFAKRFPNDGFKWVDPVAATGSGLLGDEVLQIDLEIRTDLRLACSRCLADFGLKVELPLSILYTWKKSLKNADSGTGHVYFIPPDQKWVELNSLVHEAILLDLPMKPVCSKTCKGMCPQCGLDLNESECTCSAAASDPRWQALAQLKQSQN